MKLEYTGKNDIVQRNFDRLAADLGPRAPTGPAGGALAGTYPNPTLAFNSVVKARSAYHGGGAVSVPNTGADVSMDTSMTITTGPTAEIWVFFGSMLVRADSANDTVLRGRIADFTTGAEIGVGFTQRAYYNGVNANLSGFSTIALTGVYSIAASTSRVIGGQCRVQGGFGGVAFEGGVTHNRILGIKVTDWA